MAKSDAMIVDSQPSSRDSHVVLRRAGQVESFAAVKTTRIPALDFTKGALVLIMVLYHWLNYFVGPQGFYYVYLRFLPPSFIFITGFLISHLYLSKSRNLDARLPPRLLVRGLKLLGIFIALNALISVSITAQPGKLHFLDFSFGSLISTYITGNFPNGRAAVFYVLLPISYLLILSAGLLVVSRSYRQIFHLVCGTFLLTIFALSLQGTKSGNLELLTMGLLGVSAGYIPMQKINRTLQPPYALLLAYLFYLAAITAWEVPYAGQIVGVCLTLLLLYLLGTVFGETGLVPRTIICLGRYSLFAYIAQIAILQGLRRILGHAGLGAWGLAESLLAAIALTVAMVTLMDYARFKVPIVNRVYAAVFS